MKIAVAMSGGVDSSVTAALLQQMGHQVFGITMRLFASCTIGSGEAAHDAALVAHHLDIQHYIVNFEPEFSSLIINDFISEYSCGHTPNPCVRCNRYIKFGLLLDKARELGADMLATGHYVRKTVAQDGICHLHTARNISKDQSYFLYTLTQDRLTRLLFPLGEIGSKDKVRQLARQFRLPVAEKFDSQEVCFIPGDDYVVFLEKNSALTNTQGDIFHLNGTYLGRHPGTHRYTIGQRKGLGIAWTEPLYVVEIKAEINRVIVAEQQHVFAECLMAADLSWVIKQPDTEFACACKIRYRHQPVACQVRILDCNTCEVRFTHPQKSVTPGQSVVFYMGDEILGGGRIVSSFHILP